MSKSVLVIGGSGFFGTTLRNVLNKDTDFTVSFSSTRGEAGDSGHRTLNLLNPDDVRQVKEFDLVINLSGQMTEPPADGLALNTTGMRHLLDALKECGAFLVHISSTMVYGPTQLAVETSPLHPASPYASAKTEAENLIRTSLPQDRFLIVRLCNLYGPGQRKGLLWFVLDKVRNGHDIVVDDNNGELRRHFVHVDDAAHILHDLLSAGTTGIVNVAGEESFSIKELVALCEKILGKSIRATYGGVPPRDTVASIDTTVLRKLVSVTFRHSVEEYLRTQLRGL